jgi:hypothetical protein
LIAFQNLSSKFNSALGVPAQGFAGCAARQRRANRGPDAVGTPVTNWQSRLPGSPHRTIGPPIRGCNAQAGRSRTRGR